MSLKPNDCLELGYGIFKIAESHVFIRMQASVQEGHQRGESEVCDVCVIESCLMKSFEYFNERCSKRVVD
jgi:hypothetical protein